MRGLVLAALAALSLATASLAQDADNVLVIDVEGEAPGTIEIELLPDVAPQHSARMKELARRGDYDGVIFHRVIKGFMAQTGDVEHGRSDGDTRRAGTGGSDLGNVPAEFSALPFDRGTLGAARAQNPDSANSQFFICFDDVHVLNGNYTVYGRVIDGMEHVDAIPLGERRRDFDDEVERSSRKRSG